MTTETQTQTERDGRIESLVESILRGTSEDYRGGGTKELFNVRWIATRIVEAGLDQDIEHAIEMR